MKSATARGFTLIEMMVAITVLSIIAVLSWRGLDGVLRTREEVSKRITTQRALQAVFAQIDADLRDAARDPVAESPLLGVVAGPGELLVLRQTPLPETGALRYQLVRYRVQFNALVRSARTVTTPAQIDAMLAEPQWPDDANQVLADEVIDFGLRVWSAQGWVDAPGDGAAGLDRAQALSKLMQATVPVAQGVQVSLETAAGERFVRASLVRD